MLLLIGMQFVSPAVVLGFQAIPNFDAAFAVMTVGMLLILPSGLVSGLYRARGLYGRAVRLQNWGALAAQLGQLAAIVATGSLLAVTIAFAAAQLLTALYFLLIDAPRLFPYLGGARARHSWAWSFGQFRKAAPFAVAGRPNWRWSICRCCWSARWFPIASPSCNGPDPHCRRLAADAVRSDHASFGRRAWPRSCRRPDRSDCAAFTRADRCS